MLRVARSLAALETAVGDVMRRARLPAGAEAARLAVTPLAVRRRELCRAVGLAVLHSPIVFARRSARHATERAVGGRNGACEIVAGRLRPAAKRARLARARVAVGAAVLCLAPHCARLIRQVVLTERRARWALGRRWLCTCCAAAARSCDGLGRRWIDTKVAALAVTARAVRAREARLAVALAANYLPVVPRDGSARDGGRHQIRGDGRARRASAGRRGLAVRARLARARWAVRRRVLPLALGTRTGNTNARAHRTASIARIDVRVVSTGGASC